jgi:membrane protein implicated in regulation of membrane protease activity
MSIVCAGLSVFPFIAAFLLWAGAATGPVPHHALLLALGLVGLAVLSFAVSSVFRVRIGEPVFKRRTR